VEAKVAPESRAAGKAVRDLRLPEKCVLAVVIRKGELMIPYSDTVLQVADEVLAAVNTNHVKDLADLLG